MTIELSILIYRGYSIDTARYRHVALFLEASDGDTLLGHVTNVNHDITHHRLRFELLEDYDPDGIDEQRAMGVEDW